MEVKSETICIILGYRLTEHQVIDGEDIVNTYFNIRDDLGKVYGRNFDDVEELLTLLFDIESNVKHHIQFDKTTHEFAT